MVTMRHLGDVPAPHMGRGHPKAGGVRGKRCWEMLRRDVAGRLCITGADASAAALTEPFRLWSVAPQSTEVHLQRPAVRIGTTRRPPALIGQWEGCRALSTEQNGKGGGSTSARTGGQATLLALRSLPLARGSWNVRNEEILSLRTAVQSKKCKSTSSSSS